MFNNEEMKSKFDLSSLTRLPKEYVRCVASYSIEKKRFKIIPWYVIEECKGLLQLEREDNKCHCQPKCKVVHSRLILRCVKCSLVHLITDAHPDLDINLEVLNDQIKKEWEGECGS